MPGLRRYIQCLTLPEEYQNENAPDYDGVDEIWFDDMAALEQSRGTSESGSMMVNAEALTSEMTPLFADEVVLLDNYPTLNDRKDFVKYIAMLYLKDGVPIGDFQRHWKDVHGPINVRNIKGMKRYVQSHILPQMFEGSNPPPYGGLPEPGRASRRCVGPRATLTPSGTPSGRIFAQASGRSLRARWRYSPELAAAPRPKRREKLFVEDLLFDPSHEQQPLGSSSSLPSTRQKKSLQ